MKKPKKYSKIPILSVVAIMYVICICIFIFIWQADYELATFDQSGNYLVVAIYVFLSFIFVGVYKASKVGTLRLGEIIYSNILTMLITNFIIYVQLCTIAREILTIRPMIIIFIYQIIVIILFSSIANKLYFKYNEISDVLVICDNINNEYEVILKMQQIKERYTIKKVILQDVGIDEIKKNISKFSTILIGNVDPAIKVKVIEHSFEQNKRVYVLPNIYDIILASSYQTQIFDTMMLFCKNSGPSAEQLVVKRIIDVVFSIIALIVLSPFMLITAVVIKITDGGSVFYKQKRATINGRTFNVLKFRSMVVDAEKNGAQKAVDNDDRITPIGKFIRKTRIDETPQLLNILKGDMSIVGPRPERLENIVEYCTDLPEFKLRLKVKGGLTGYAQIYGKYNTSPADKLNLDLMYIQKFSLIRDFNLMLATVKILFMPTSTEGFKKNKE